MQSQAITAKSGTEKAGTLKEFEGTVDLPETCSEAVEMYEEKQCLSYITRSVVIDAQSSLRRPAGAGGAKAKTAYLKLVQFRDAGAMTEEQIRDISGYNPENDTDS